MDLSKYIIPNQALKDTLAILTVLLSLPSPLAFCVVTLYILTSTSKKFASKLFTKLFGSSSIHHSTSIAASTSSFSGQAKDQPENRLLTPLVLTCIIDVVLSLLVRFSLPRCTRYIFMLADAVIASSICGNNPWNSCLATLLIGVIDYLFKVLVVYLDYSFGFKIDNPDLFPYLPKTTSPFSYFVKSFVSFFKSSSTPSNIQIHHYFTHSNQSRLISYFSPLINHLNLILSIHVVLMVFASICRKNFISRNINQLSSLDPDINCSPFSTFLLKKGKEDKNIKLVEIELSNDIALSVLNLGPVNNDTEDQTPASYPSNSIPFKELVSTSSIVQENFEVYCRSSFTKPKHSSKALQPLWSLIGTIKAMKSRKDVYSGSMHFDEGDNNSLVLSDAVGKYDEFELQNYEDSCRKEKISIFINYIGETLIGFQLTIIDKKFDGVIVVRVNGLIWYQVSSGYYDEDRYLIVSGLTPLSQYDIQFWTEETTEEGQRHYLIDDLIVSTVSSNGENISTTHISSNPSGKPLSPLTTLRESLITTNENLNRERAKLKKTKKELSKKLSSYKQDIEALKVKISNSDKNDEKNWKKVLSLKRTCKQVEEEGSKIEAKFGDFESKETEISEIHTVEKRKFDLSLRNFQNFKNDFDGKVAVKSNKLKELNNEIESLNARKDRVSNKVDKVHKETDKIDAEINELFEKEVQSRVDERKERASKRTTILSEFKKEIEKMETDLGKLTTENEKLRNGVASLSQHE